jgi:hypothetical protein
MPLAGRYKPVNLVLPLKRMPTYTHLYMNRAKPSEIGMVNKFNANSLLEYQPFPRKRFATPAPLCHF